jgi:long-chain acyl-CoA synthetase
MLYERWRHIASVYQNQVALRDLAGGRRWTFRQLAATTEAADGNPSCVAFPQGGSAEFILCVLRSWRLGQVLCPLEPGQSVPELTGVLPQDVVHLKTTSGVTGTPRLVAFTAEQLLADADNIAATMGLRAEWPNLGVVSLAHSYGFSNLVLPLLLHGIPLLLVEAAFPEAVRRAAAMEPNVTLAAVPALWRAWHQAKVIPANVRLALSAGAPLPSALEQEVYASHGLKIHNFYGSSECGGIAYDPSPQPRPDGTCAGAPLRNVELSVGQDGCLEVRSRAVASTYWPEPSPNLAQGVFHACDLAEISGGLLYLRGRISDQINVAGRKVSPETIEWVLASHPQVRECVVFGVPSADAERGENIVACVALQGAASTEAVRQFMLSKLPAWQLPRDWWVVEAIAPNHRGKLSRAEWRKRYLERRSPPPGES